MKSLKLFYTILFLFGFISITHAGSRLSKIWIEVCNPEGVCIEINDFKNWEGEHDRRVQAILIYNQHKTNMFVYKVFIRWSSDEPNGHTAIDEFEFDNYLTAFFFVFINTKYLKGMGKPDELNSQVFYYMFNKNYEQP